MTVAEGIWLSLASIEGLIFFAVILAFSALTNWLKQKQERAQQERREASGLPEGAPLEEETGEAPQRRKAWDWEEELRRLLEGGERKPASEPPPALAEAPSAEAVEPPPVVAIPRTTEARPIPPPPAPAPVSTELQDEMAATQQRLQRRLAALKETRAAYQRIRRPDRSAAARTDRTSRATGFGASAPTPYAMRRTTGSTAVRRVRKSLRRPGTAREAVVAMEVLGQPKGLQV